jgi:hypothetical protein
MGLRTPNYWRAFWLTAAFVGAINAFAFLCYVSLPVVPDERHPEILERAVPDWLAPFLAISTPGAAVMHYAVGMMSPFDRIGCCQVISTAFWGLIAVCVEWFTSNGLGNRPARTTDAPSKSNEPSPQ